MPRTTRNAPGGLAYLALNRANARSTIGLAVGQSVAPASWGRRIEGAHFGVARGAFAQLALAGEPTTYGGGN